MTSLQTRLSAGLSAGLAALTLLVLAGGYYSLRRVTEDFVVTRLEHDMDTVLSALQFDGEGRPLLATERMGAPFHQPYSGHYYKITTASGEIRSRSLWDDDLPALPALSHNHSTRSFAVGPQNQQLLLVGRAFQLQSLPVTIVVTEDFTPMDKGLKRLLLQFGLIALTWARVLSLLKCSG